MKVKIILTLTLLFLVFLIQSDAANILLVFPIPAFSHYNLGNKLLHALADHGHNVTIIGAFVDKNLPKSCKEIYLKELNDEATEKREEMMKQIGKSSNFFRLFFLSSMTREFTHKTLSNKDVQELLKDPSIKFDAVVVEEFLNHAMKGFAYHFDAPLIVFSTVGATSWVNEITGNPSPWSYVTTPLLSYTSRMSMWQRTNNALFQVFQSFIEAVFVKPKMNALIDQYFSGAPHIAGLNSNVSVILLNSHVSTNKPVPLLPNMIEIGGFHVDPPKKLPENLQKYLDLCKKGFIYFSMGSNFQSKYLDKGIIDALLAAFSKLNVEVLWKFEDDSLPGKPENVKIMKWVPQQDVLAHPNIKLFITHGGLLSTIETIYHGVPIIGIPAFADQKMNMVNAVTAGYAVQLDLFDLSEEKLTAALQEVLNNSKYSENAKQRSRLMHDRVRNPKDTAVYWIEYAIRHKGEKHFRSAALDLAWYELYMVDAAIFVVIVGLLQLYLSCKLIKYLWRRRQQKSKKHKQP